MARLIAQLPGVVDVLQERWRCSQLMTAELGPCRSCPTCGRYCSDPRGGRAESWAMQRCVVAKRMVFGSRLVEKGFPAA